MTKLPTDLYPPTQVVNGKMTMEQYAAALAENLYDELVCDRRLEPEQVYALLKYQHEKRNNG